MQLIPNASDILLAVIDATPDAIFVKDLEGRYVLVNRVVLAEGKPMSFEGVATNSSGTQAYLLTKGVYRAKGGKIPGIYGISHETPRDAIRDGVRRIASSIIQKAGNSP